MFFSIKLVWHLFFQVAKNLLQSKTEEINAQLKSLEAVVRRSDPPKKSDSTVVKPAVKSPEEIVEKYESDLRKADEALDGLANFSVTTGGDE